MKRDVRYSEAFKQQVVSELEGGRYGSPYEASQAYGIRGATTVGRWVREFGKSHLLRKVVRVEKQGEPGEIKRLKERVRQLETSLADAHMDWALEKSFFENLRSRGLLVPPLPKSTRTTNFRHSLPIFRNLIIDMELTAPNQVWVNDITYIRTWEGFEHLSLNMDLHSH